EPADHRVLRPLRDLAHRREVALRGNWKAGLDDIDAHLIEQFSDLELLFMGHRRARALLTVAQCRIENDDAVLFGRCLGTHWKFPSRRMRPRGALWDCSFSVIPRVPRRISPAGPQGQVRRRSLPRMRVAVGPAAAAARSIAQDLWRVDMALSIPSYSTSRVARFGKTRVNPRGVDVFYRTRTGQIKPGLGQQCCQFSLVRRHAWPTAWPISGAGYGFKRPCLCRS